MWSGVSIQVRRQFPLSNSASVPQVVPLGLRAGLRHLPGSGGLSSLGGVRRRGGYLQEKVSCSWTDPPFPRPPTAWLPPSYPLAQRTEDAGPVQIRVWLPGRS